MKIERIIVMNVMEQMENIILAAQAKEMEQKLDLTETFWEHFVLRSY